MMTDRTHDPVTWHHLKQPTAEELASVVREAELLPLDAGLLATTGHRPEIISRPPYLLFLLSVPIFNKKLRVTSGAALYGVVTSTSLWTIEYDPIAAFAKIEPEQTADSPLAFWLALLTALGESTFHKLDRLAKQIDIVEDAVFQGNERKMVEEISLLTRDAMDFRKIIRPQRRLFTTMPDHPLATPLRDQWQLVNQQLQKTWEMLENIYESIDQLGATNSSLLQHKENELLRLLSLYSIITIPAWILITPFVPSQADATSGHRIVYWGVFVVLLLTLFIIVWRFRRKRVL